VCSFRRGCSMTRGKSNTNNFNRSRGKCIEHAWVGLKEGVQGETQFPIASTQKRDFMAKLKITSEAQPCKKCGGRLQRKHHDASWRPAFGQAYWFAWWLQCIDCGAKWMVEAAKVHAAANIGGALEPRGGCECMGC
jgi:hypothetical protein